MPQPDTATPAEPAFTVPDPIAAVIASFAARTAPFEPLDVYTALCGARQALADPSPAENTGAWAEVLAFGVAGHEHGEKPWGTHFGPMGSMTDREGVIHYSPNARDADAAVLGHWKQQATSITQPVLCARYNDLVWDMSKFIADERPDVAYARRAINAYLAVAQQEGADDYHAFPAAARTRAGAENPGHHTPRCGARGHPRAASRCGRQQRPAAAPT